MACAIDASSDLNCRSSGSDEKEDEAGERGVSLPARLRRTSFPVSSASKISDGDVDFPDELPSFSADSASSST